MNLCENCIHAAPCNLEKGFKFCEADNLFLKVFPVECHNFECIDL